MTGRIVIRWYKMYWSPCISFFELVFHSDSALGGAASSAPSGSVAPSDSACCCSFLCARGDWLEIGQAKVEHERRGWKGERKVRRWEMGQTYHLWASIRRTQRAVIFNLSLTLVVGSSLYFSSSAIGRILANQYGNNAGSSGG